jgi:hypothetical protein
MDLILDKGMKTSQKSDPIFLTLSIRRDMEINITVLSCVSGSTFADGRN